MTSATDRFAALAAPFRDGITTITQPPASCGDSGSIRLDECDRLSISCTGEDTANLTIVCSQEKALQIVGAIAAAYGIEGSGAPSDAPMPVVQRLRALAAESEPDAAAALNACADAVDKMLAGLKSAAPLLRRMTSDDCSADKPYSMVRAGILAAEGGGQLHDGPCPMQGGSQPAFCPECGTERGKGCGAWRTR